MLPLIPALPWRLNSKSSSPKRQASRATCSRGFEWFFAASLHTLDSSNTILKRPLPSGCPNRADSYLWAHAGVSWQVVGAPSFRKSCLFWVVSPLQRPSLRTRRSAPNRSKVHSSGYDARLQLQKLCPHRNTCSRE